MSAPQIGTIERTAHGATVFSGKPATELYALITLEHALRFEIRTPGMRISSKVNALKAAKQRTGLKTNDRRTQLARVLVMIEEARAKCVTVVAGEQEVPS